jgi:hypothetical protein
VFTSAAEETLFPFNLNTIIAFSPKIELKHKQLINLLSTPLIGSN